MTYYDSPPFYIDPPCIRCPVTLDEMLDQMSDYLLEGDKASVIASDDFYSHRLGWWLQTSGVRRFRWFLDRSSLEESVLGSRRPWAPLLNTLTGRRDLMRLLLEDIQKVKYPRAKPSSMWDILLND